MPQIPPSPSQSSPTPPLPSSSARPSSATRRLAGTALLAATALVAGCAGMGMGPTGAGGASTPPPRPVQVCNAAPAQSFVGKSNTSTTLEAARKQSGAYMARVLREGQPTTMEFNQERLNLVVDGTGRIVAVRCG